MEAVALRLADADIGSIVIEEEMGPVGIVTDRDVAVRLAAGDPDAPEVAAADIMTPDPVTTSLDAGLLELTNAMCDHSVRRMPVVDESGRLVGIVTLDGVMVRLVTELSNLSAVGQSESPTY